VAKSTDFFTPPDAAVWTQIGGTIPGQAYELLACGDVMETTVSAGEKEPIFAKDLSRRGKWYAKGKKYALPDTHNTGLRMSMPRKTASLLEDVYKTGCPLNIQVPISKCTTLEEFNSGWESKLLYEGADLSEITIPPLGGEQGEDLDEVWIEGPMTFEYFDRILKMRFTERAEDTILYEAIDGVWCGPPSCGDCGPYDEGCNHLYVITRANVGSPGLSGQLVYTNNKVDYAVIDIPTLGGLDPDAIACVGDYLMVISEAAGNHQYIQRATVLAAADWVEVDTGYVAFHGPRAIYAKSASEVFIGAAAGYIYKTTDYQTSVETVEAGTLTTEDINAIDGDGGDVIVAVGDNNIVLLSTNDGETFGLLDGPLAGSDLQAIAVLDAYNWIVGGDGGAFYRTNDQGTTWTAIPFQGSGAGAIVHDVEMSAQTNQVGYAAIEISGVGYVYRTTDSGTHWYRNAPAIVGLDDNDRIDFVAPCPDNINVVAAGGLDATGADGYLAIAE
jgi:hypothetical protein